MENKEITPTVQTPPTVPTALFVDIINEQKNKEETKNIWDNSIYKHIVKLKSNNVGICGETFIHNICKLSGIEANIDGTMTKKMCVDGHIKNKTVEIKTAHQGCSTNSFQHELGEKSWTSNYMIFMDISPTCIYLTIFPNFTEEVYKNGIKCEPYFPSKIITWRKKVGSFKLDTSIGINERNVKEGHAIKITEKSTISDIHTFINTKIGANVVGANAVDTNVANAVDTNVANAVAGANAVDTNVANAVANVIGANSVAGAIGANEVDTNAVVACALAQ